MKLMQRNRLGHWWPWEAVAFCDHFPIDGPKIEHFSFSASDYDRGDDQIVCPCGAELDRWFDSGGGLGELGVAIEVARAHLAEAHGELMQARREALSRP